MRPENAPTHRDRAAPGLMWLVATIVLLLPAVGSAKDGQRPVADPATPYVSSAECKACHPGNYASWHASYHRTMTQVAGPDAILGDFAGAPFEFQRIRFRPFVEDGLYFIGVQDLETGAAETVREVALVTGSHNYQVYWHTTDRPRLLGQFPIVWFTDRRQWIPRVAAFVQPNDRIRDNDELGRWNFVCVECHTTNGRMEVTGGEGEVLYDTRASEFGIACEACHGPGEEHARRNRNPLERYMAHLLGHEQDDILNPGAMSAAESTRVCGQCHSVHTVPVDWQEEGGAYRQVIPFDEHRKEVWVGPGDEAKLLPRSRVFRRSYAWPDGVGRVRGREYHDVTRSPCFQGGEFSCLTCHAMHKEPGDLREDRDWASDQLRPAALDGTVCLGCHEAFAEPDARTLHTRHAAGSGGNDCLDCHMPFTTIGFLRGMRSHRVTVPDLRASLDTGRPLACNQCHLGESLAWSMFWLEDWYGQQPVILPDEHRSTAASLVDLWRGDAARRLLAAWNFGRADARALSGSDWQAPHLARMLADDYVAVRQAAATSLLSLPGMADARPDPFTEPGDRRAEADRLHRYWQERAASTNRLPSDPPEELMFATPGMLDEARIRAAITARDPRPLVLAE